MVRAERAARWTYCPTWSRPTVQFKCPNCPTCPNFQACALTQVLATQEANYAHQQELDMIPLMVQNDYSPKGWLGLILGTRLW